MSAAANRQQNRFSEDSHRFDVEKPKRHYNKKSDQMQGPPESPQSTSPGPWVPETIVNSLPQEPAHKNASTIRDSYRRYCINPRVSSHVGDSNFSLLDYGAPDESVREDLYRLDDDGEVVDSDEQDAKTSDFDVASDDEFNEREDCANSRKEAQRRHEVISNDEIDSGFRRWFSDSTAAEDSRFSQILFCFFDTKNRRTFDSLYHNGTSDDFLTDFTFGFFDDLKKMKSAGENTLETPSHYFARSWVNARNDALNEFSKNRVTNPSLVTPLEDSDSPDDEPLEINYSDNREFDEWQQNTPTAIFDSEESETERREFSRKAKLPNLTPDQKETVGYLRAGLQQKEIAQRRGVTPQAISKKLIQIRRKLQAMPDSVVSQ